MAPTLAMKMPKAWTVLASALNAQLALDAILTAVAVCLFCIEPTRQ